MTLRLRLSLAFLLIVVAPLLAAALIVDIGVPHALNTSAANRLTSAEAAAKSWVEQTCVQARLTAEVLARETAALAGPARTSAASDIVSRGLADYATVTASDGTVITHAGTVRGGAPPDLGSCNSPQSSTSGVDAIADGVVVRSPSGHQIGRAVAAISLDAAAAERIARAIDAPVTLAVGDRVLASTESAAVAQNVASAVSKGGRAGRTQVVDRLAAPVAIPGSEVSIVVSVHKSSVHHLVAILVAVLIAAILLSAAIGTWLAGVTTRPLTELSGAATRVAEGDLDTEIEVPGGDEVGQLAAAFNEMTRELKGYAGEVEASRDRLQDSYSRLGDTLTATHDLARILGVVLDTAVDSVGAGAGAADVMQPGRDGVQLRASHGLQGRPAGRRLPLGKGIIGAVAADGQVRTGRVGSGDLVSAPGEPDARDVMAVPLRTGSAMLGVLALYDRKDGREFDSGDLQTINTFAGQAAVALDNVLLHQEAQQLSVTDALTGLGNFRSFQHSLAREVERAARFDRTLGLLIIDLDRFKSVNDAYGHQVGNDVLVEVAERLRTEVREVDIVARYGGEEFVVVLPESDSDGAVGTAARICAAMRAEVFRVPGLELSVTVSVGVAVFPRHGRNANDLIRAADRALYAAKDAGRDQWQLAADPEGQNA
jgi:two-component system, cell cycle response regulator